MRTRFPSPPPLTPARRGPAIIAGWLFFSAAYLATSRLHAYAPRLLRPTSLDRAIPFLDWSILVYASLYPLPVLALWLPKEERVRTRCFYALASASLIAFTVFALWPTEVERHWQRGQGAGVLAALWAALYALDTPGNCLPSLHVAIAALSALTLRTLGGAWRYAPLWAAAIAFSTLTTKQHLAVDLAAGAVLAAFAWAAAGAVVIAKPAASMNPARPGRLRESLDLLSLFLPGSGKKSIYDILASHNLLAETSTFVNLGDWRRARRYDDACADLARRLMLGSPPGPADAVLDVGCGFGDAARLWWEEFRPRAIVSIGDNRGHLRRAAVQGGSGPEFANADAMALPFRAGRFQKVIALESAFHFRTREAFFCEAYRVLAPGGTLSLADLAPVNDPMGWSLRRRLLFRLGACLWQFPAANLCPREAYLRKLGEAGFTDIRWESIGADVFPGFRAYSRKRLDEPEIRARLNPILRRLWKARAHGRGGDGLEYALIHARKGN